MLRFRLSVPLSAGTQLFIDQIAMGLMTLLYPGGQSIATFDGSSHFIAGGPLPQASGPPDQFKLTTTNDIGGAASLANWQTLMLRLVTQNPLILWPSSGSPTISNSLITD